MNFTKEEQKALDNLKPTIKPLLERSQSGWFLNTRSMEYKAVQSIYETKYQARINNTCPPCVESAMRAIYNDYKRFMTKVAPKEAPKDANKDLESLRQQYKEAKGKEVSKRFWNNAEWIESKLA